MMKSIIFLGGIVGIIFTGCSPTIISVKSPMNKLDKEKCFNFPSKEFLSKSPIYKQKIYQLTENALNKNNINTVYGNSNECKNYLMTDWIISTVQETVTLKGTAITSTYGNIYKNSYSYSNSYAYNGNSYSYATPDLTYQEESYKGTYLLEVGRINNDTLVVVWEGTQSGSTKGSSIQDAQKVTDNDQDLIDAMVEKMLSENNLTK